MVRERWTTYMARTTFSRLRQRPLWQVGLVLFALYVASFAAIFELIQMLAFLGPLLSVAGASLALTWAFLGIAKMRREDEWVGS